jgi:hypothetical protein
MRFFQLHSAKLNVILPHLNLLDMHLCRILLLIQICHITPFGVRVFLSEGLGMQLLTKRLDMWY